jgi:hypothetical protein
MRPTRPVPLWVFLSLLGAGALLADPAQAAGRKALLIGINEYMAVPDLRGAVNDVELIRDVLVTRFGFQPGDVETLTDADATRDNMLAAFDRLAERSAPGDFVYLHYSGHGSQAQDTDGDEVGDSRDETLIPHDGRTGQIADITDDELARAASKLADRQLVIVLDSCHSGTATRGAFVQPRAVPPDTRNELYVRPATRAVVPLVRANHVLVTGAASDQEALDGPVDGRPHGLFTYAFARTLSNAPADVSSRAVMSGVARELERVKAQLALRSMPEPQLEAQQDELDRPLFGPPRANAGASPARLPWVAVTGAGSGRVRLVGGPRLGAVPGSLWAVYPPGETAFVPGKALAEATVTELAGDDALARLEPASVSIANDSRAISLAPPANEEALPVRWIDTDAARSERIEQLLRQRLASLRFVGDGEFARFVVRVEDGRCRVLGADGESEVASLPLGDEAALADSAALLFTRWAAAAELLSLDNPSSAIQLELALASTPAKPPGAGDERGIVVVADGTAPVLRIRKAGEPRRPTNSLHLRVRSSADCFLTIVDVDAEGGVYQLFPNPISDQKGFHPKGRIQADQDVLVPDSLEPGNGAGFYLDYSPPVGTDTVRAFCAADEAVAKELRATLASLGDEPGTRAAGSRVRSALGGLRSSLARTSSRGVRIVADDGAPSASEPAPSAPVAEAPSIAPDWAAASITLEIAE